MLPSGVHRQTYFSSITTLFLEVVSRVLFSSITVVGVSGILFMSVKSGCDCVGGRLLSVLLFGIVFFSLDSSLWLRLINGVALFCACSLS